MESGAARVYNPGEVLFCSKMSVTEFWEMRQPGSGGWQESLTYVQGVREEEPRASGQVTCGSTPSVDSRNGACSPGTSRKTREGRMLKCGFSVVRETEVQIIINQLGKGRVSFLKAKELQHELHHSPVLFTCPVGG